MDHHSATRLVQAASHAVALIEKFSSTCQDDNDPDSPWKKDPDDIFRQLHEAREQVVVAAAAADRNQEGETDQITANFRALYLEMITDAFADVLDDLRKNDNAFDVTVLVDCLQSGMDFLTTREKELLLLSSSSSSQDDDDEVMDNSSNDMTTTMMTPHEQKRRALGL